MQFQCTRFVILMVLLVLAIFCVAVFVSSFIIHTHHMRKVFFSWLCTAFITDTRNLQANSGIPSRQMTWTW
ncbi:hypothetical protein HU200_020060 [Digitaria exilis]|uniref:Uncharacterized protein n=1 Tax=Digitaria exilis TaxID=1010633 RepID=A0A835F1E1_9POAL|nr:hypothetical protein HU200_020060 [Digitaria exilis]